jgi:hypothetical protein
MDQRGWWLRRGGKLKLPYDFLYELMVIVWIVASPLAIARWVARFDDPVGWAAFTAGVLGVLVGWLIVAPHQAKRAETLSRRGS